MLILGIILAIVLILLVLFLFLKFSVIISIKKGNLELWIKVLGLKLKIPLDGKKNEEAEKPKDENSVMKSFMDVRNTFNRMRIAATAALSYLRYKIELDDIGILGDFGTGDAATTAIAYGSVQAFTASVTSLVGQYFELKKPATVKVDLNFLEFVFEIGFHALIKARPIHLLIGALKFFTTLKKNK